MDRAWSGSTYDQCEPLMDGTTARILLLLFTISAYVILTLTEPRTCCRNWCWGKCGILLSVDMLESKQSKGMFVAAFVMLTYGYIEVNLRITTYARISILLEAFVRAVTCGFMCFLSLPLLNCLSEKNSCFRQIAGLVYSLVVFPVTFLTTIITCEFQSMTLTLLLKNIFQGITFVSTGAYIIYTFGHRILDMKNVVKSKNKKWTESYQAIYVKQMFMKPTLDTLNSQSLVLFSEKRAWFKKNVCQIRPDFDYSTTILTSTAVGVMNCLFLFSVGYGWVTDLYLATRYSTYYQSNETNTSRFCDAIGHILIDEGTYSCLAILDSTFICCSLSAIFSLVVMVITALKMLKSYKSNVLNLYRRQTTEYLLDISDLSHVELVCSAVEYAGFQVAQFITGYVLQTIVLFIVLCIPTYAVILPLMFSWWDYMRKLGESFLSAILLIILTYGGQRLLVKYCFLEERGKVLALKNRKSFFNMMFFSFLYNTFIGIVISLVRLATCTLLGLWLFPRLDRSVFPRTFEQRDTAFKAYICLLHLEELHANPILVTFVNLLCERTASSDTNDTLSTSPIISVDEPNPSRVARNRWHLAMMLVNNESLRKDRKHNLLLEKKVDVEIHELQVPF